MAKTPIGQLNGVPYYSMEGDLTEYPLIGQQVLPSSPYCKEYKPGTITGTFLMVSAAGILRRKWSIEYYHPRTKGKKCSVAKEYGEFQPLPWRAPQ